MKSLIVICLFSLSACAQVPTFGIEDTATGESMSCVPIPERNVQRCEAMKDGKKVFVEIPLKEAE